MKNNSIKAKWEILSKNGKMSPKQISIRLPIDIEAKIDNFISLYPNVSKNQIIIDLISSGINQTSDSCHG